MKIARLFLSFILVAIAMTGIWMGVGEIKEVVTNQTANGWTQTQATVLQDNNCNGIDYYGCRTRTDMGIVETADVLYADEVIDIYSNPEGDLSETVPRAPFNWFRFSGILWGPFAFYLASLVIRKNQLANSTARPATRTNYIHPAHTQRRKP